MADKSLKEGDECSETVQCNEGLLCPPALFKCGKPCTKIYDINSECGPDKVCAPHIDLANRGKFKGGVCVPPECNVNDAASADSFCKTEGGALAAANPNNRCIRVAQNGGMCLPACLVGIRVADSSRGVDQCVADLPGNPTHCGRVGVGDLVCVPAGAAVEGSKCTQFPLSVGSSDDACSLNIKANNTADLPLLCMNTKATVNPAEGELRCRKAACNPMNNADCASNQTCVTVQGLTFCKGANE